MDGAPDDICCEHFQFDAAKYSTVLRSAATPWGELDRPREELRGDVGLRHHMSTLRERDIPTTLRRMSTEDVAAWCESFHDGSANRILGQMELQRRRDRRLRIRIWIATGLASVALVLSSIALFVATR